MSRRHDPSRRHPVPARHRPRIVSFAVLLSLACLLAAPAGPAAGATPVAIPVDGPIQALSPALGELCERKKVSLGVRVVDLATGEGWACNGERRYVAASSLKLAILLSALERNEQRRLALSSGDRVRLRSMVVWSDNAAAHEFYPRVGGARGMASFLESVGADEAGWRPRGTSWGWSMVSPRTTSHLLVRLARGTLLTDVHRAWALSLLRSVVPGQRFGVGEAAPTDARVALKNGWVQGPDGVWSVSSSGIVEAGERRWVVSIYLRAGNLPTGRRIVGEAAGYVTEAMLARRPAG